MLTKEDVASLLQDLESDRIERTILFREDKLGPADCYSTNYFADYKKPGYILLGVEDDGKGANMKPVIRNCKKSTTSKPMAMYCHSLHCRKRSKNVNIGINNSIT